MNELEQAAALIIDAKALLIGAGAGMGVDSGLPDFRSEDGFWNAYPVARQQDKTFTCYADAQRFSKDFAGGWGFYGHRYHLYQHTAPHLGYELLRRWAQTKLFGAFVYTSNVDGLFQKAGFDEESIVECHGSLNHLQCLRSCTNRVWRSGHLKISVDENTLLAQPPYPRCPECGWVARPNVLMFNDWNWLSGRTNEQVKRFRQWLGGVPQGGLVVIELGAGTAVPSVKRACETAGGRLIRINPRDYQTHGDAISIPMGALEALQRIGSIIEEQPSHG